MLCANSRPSSARLNVNKDGLNQAAAWKGKPKDRSLIFSCSWCVLLGPVHERSTTTRSMPDPGSRSQGHTTSALTPPPSLSSAAGETEFTGYALDGPSSEKHTVLFTNPRRHICLQPASALDLQDLPKVQHGSHHFNGLELESRREKKTRVLCPVPRTHELDPTCQVND